MTDGNGEFETLLQTSVEQLNAYREGDSKGVTVSKVEINPAEKIGIVFKIGTTDFDAAIRLCEMAFADCTTTEWTQVKESRDFEQLSQFLEQADVDNDLFVLPK